MIAVAFGTDAQAVLDNPPVLVAPILVAIAVAMLSTALMHSDVEHRNKSVIDQQLCDAIASETVAGGLRVTMCLGVGASRRGESFDYERVFHQANTMLYAAKHDGPNRVASRPRPLVAS